MLITKLVFESFNEMKSQLINLDSNSSKVGNSFYVGQFKPKVSRHLLV